MDVRVLRIIVFAVAICVSAATRGQEIPTLEEVGEIYESQWRDVAAMRLEYSQEVSSRIMNCSYDDCSWEFAGVRARVIEMRARDANAPLTREEANKESPATRRRKFKLMRSRSDCYYDGEKTYELVVPLERYPLEKVSLEDYYELRRAGVRATLSDQYQHWRFWSLCPIHRYFSVPSEEELLTLPQLLSKYDATVEIRKSSRGDREANIKVNSPETEDHLARIKSWTLYLSLNLSRGGALSRLQSSYVLNNETQDTIITEYDASNFKEARRGLWVPSSIVTSMHGVGTRNATVKTTIRTAKISDRPDPSPGFSSFKFPENLVVTESVGVDASGKPNRIFHVWGDGKPTLTFQSEDEFKEFYENAYGPEIVPDDRPPLGRRARLLICVGVAFVVLVMIFGAYVFFDKGRADEDDE